MISVGICSWRRRLRVCRHERQAGDAFWAQKRQLLRHHAAHRYAHEVNLLCPSCRMQGSRGISGHVLHREHIATVFTLTYSAIVVIDELTLSL